MSYPKISDRILNITKKYSVDGSVSSHILSKTFPNISIIFSSYSDIDEILEKSIEKLYNNEFDYIIVTDNCPIKNTHLLYDSKVIFIDHNENNIHLKSPKNNRYVYPHYCSSSIVKKLCEKVYNKDFKYLDSLIYLVDDYDRGILKEPRSKLLVDIYYMYWHEMFIERFKSGFDGFLPNEKQFLKEKNKKVLTAFENTVLYDFTTIRGCLFIGDLYSNDICDLILKNADYDIAMNINSSSISLKTNKEYINLDKILKKLEYGGGYKNYGGIKYIDNIDKKQKIETLEKYLYDTIQEIRK